MSVTNFQFQRGAVNASTKKQTVTLSGLFYHFKNSSGQWASDYRWWFEWTRLADSYVVKGPYNTSSGQDGEVLDSSGSLQTRIPGTVAGTTADNNYQSAEFGPLQCDRSYSVRGVVYGSGFPSGTGKFSYGTPETHKTSPAANFSGSVGAASAITFQSASFQVSFVPNTYESYAQVYVQYKKQEESSWTTYVSYANQSGYATISPAAINLTGLSQATTYNVRIYATRNVYTTNPLGYDEFVSATMSFTTLAANPDITTSAATSVGAVSATLNAVVDPNNIATTVSFQYGTSSGIYTLETAGVAYSGDGNQYPTAVITSLVASQTYYFRAKAVYAGGTLYGSELSFTTTGNPDDEAKGVDLMQTLQFEGQYGTAKRVSFTLKQLAATNNNVLYSGTKPAQADCTIVHTTSGGVVSVQGTASDNAFDDATGTYVYSLLLSAAEMSAEVVDVIIHSVDTGTRPFRDVHLQIRTALRLTAIDLDATNAAVDTTAFKCTGKGTGHGIQANAGGSAGSKDIDAILNSSFLRVFVPAASSSGTSITLDSAASDTADYYNGCILAVIGGGETAGEGQSRNIIGYSGAGHVATLDAEFTQPVTTDAVCVLIPGPRVWDQRAGGELTSLPTEDSSYGEYLQLLFQRFAFKITQDVQQQIWYDKNNTAKFYRTVSDTGQEQVLERLTE